MKILTFDIEEWFHILDNETTKTEAQWASYESRIHINMERILRFLDENDQNATFFCLGWVAEKYPDIIRTIVKKGYEIGSHGYSHQLVYEQSPQAFRYDLDRSIKLLEDISGNKIKYFRAPGFSITEKNVWAFEILYEYGIEVDCSIFPLSRAHGGFSSYSASGPSVLSYNGVKLREFPISYVNLAGVQIVFSGGGYFRIFPYGLIKKWTNDSDYVMSYLHPRDFDSGQQIIAGLSIDRKFKSYVGIRGALVKLKYWIDDYSFIDMKTAIEAVDWDSVPVVAL